MSKPPLDKTKLVVVQLTFLHLFFVISNNFFFQQYVIESLRAKLLIKKVSLFGFLGHSFRKIVAQIVLNNNMLDEDIENLNQC